MRPGSRPPPAAQRLPSQRATAEFRGVEAERAELQRRLQVKDDEIAKAHEYRNVAEKKQRELENDVRKLQGQLAERKNIEKIKSPSVYDTHAKEVSDYLQRFDVLDIVPLLMRALTKLEKHFKIKLFDMIRHDERFKPVVAAIVDERDAVIHKNLTGFFDGDSFSLMRLICKISKRECHLMFQVFKWHHHADGTKTRRKLAPDSKQNAPPLFEVAAIEAAESRAEAASKLVLHEHTDGRGADVSGKPCGLDQAVFNAVEATKADRTRGMATAGTADDPHMVVVTGDGGRG